MLLSSDWLLWGKQNVPVFDTRVVILIQQSADVKLKQQQL